MATESTLARASGVALVEHDGKIHAVEHGTVWAYTMGFVLGLITFILGAFGLVQIVLALSGSNGMALLGLVFVAIAAVGAVGLWLIVSHVRKRNEAPLGSRPVLVIFDVPAGQLCSGQAQPLTPLAHVHMRHKFQIGSSSRALEVVWSGGSVLLVRGNPLAGGIGPIESAQRDIGIRVG